MHQESVRLLKLLRGLHATPTTHTDTLRHTPWTWWPAILTDYILILCILISHLSTLLFISYTYLAEMIIYVSHLC